MASSFVNHSQSWVVNYCCTRITIGLPHLIPLTSSRCEKTPRWVASPVLEIHGGIDRQEIPQGPLMLYLSRHGKDSVFFVTWMKLNLTNPTMHICISIYILYGYIHGNSNSSPTNRKTHTHTNPPYRNFLHKFALHDTTSSDDHEIST